MTRRTALTTLLGIERPVVQARTAGAATEKLAGDPLPYPAQLSLSLALGAAAAERGSDAFLAMWAGQAAPLAREMPAGEVVTRIAHDAERIIEALAR